MNMIFFKRSLAGAFLAAAVFGTGMASFAGPASEIPAPGSSRGELEAALTAEVPAARDPGDTGIFDVNLLPQAAEVSSLVLMVGVPGDSDGGTLTFYTRGKDEKLQAQFSVPAVNGLNGISADKKEGDKKTPSGFYRFTQAFGNKADPGSVMPYHRIAEGDVWVDDSASRYYNRMVNENRVTKDWSSAERLWKANAFYDYALNIGYNMEGTPGKGSAIFLHCPKLYDNTWSYGCITIPRERVVELLRTVDEKTGILIVPEEKALWDYLPGEKTGNGDA